ncbi:hypothetical protein GCM10008957_53150 [Deinococcus ruber]|uniref:Uncharacterized protein n=2 Tax=Deinococcus ruber TaxID=1848197 RepID=A0A918KWH0_9DEIO|nr:hypothetical protein GCM10008957_53150 [Deinococcus ruber]
MLLSGPNAAVSALQEQVLTQVLAEALPVSLVVVARDIEALLWASTPRLVGRVQTVMIGSAEHARQQLQTLQAASERVPFRYGVKAVLVASARASEVLMNAGLLPSLRGAGLGLVLNVPHQVPVMVMENLFGLGVFWPGYVPRALWNKVARFEAERGYVWRPRSVLSPLHLDGALARAVS